LKSQSFRPSKEKQQESSAKVDLPSKIIPPVLFSLSRGETPFVPPTKTAAAQPKKAEKSRAPGNQRHDTQHRKACEETHREAQVAALQRCGREVAGFSLRLLMVVTPKKTPKKCRNEREKSIGSQR